MKISESPQFSVEDVINQSGFGRYQYRMLFVCGLAWSTMAIQVCLMTFLKPEIVTEWDLSDAAIGTVEALFFTGMLLGAFLWGCISDRYGRRVGYLGAVSVAGIFGLCTTFSQSIEVFAFLRFVTGIGIGGESIPFTLLAEFSPKYSRAKLLLVNLIFWPIGILFGIGIAWTILPSLGWRWFLIFSAIPICLNIFLLLIIPESPRFLLLKCKFEKAEKILHNIVEENRGQYPKGTLIREKEIQNGSIQDLLRIEFRRTTLILWFIWFSVTFGYFGIIFITPRFFDHSDIYLVTFITTISEIPGFLLPLVFVDRIGRKNGMLLFFVMFGCFCLSLIDVFQIPTYKIGSIICIFGARLFIAGCFGIVYLYTTEVYPTLIRATGLGTTLVWSRLGGALATFTAHTIRSSVVMILFATLAFSSAFCCHLLEIETRGMDLKDELTQDDDVQRSSQASIEMKRFQQL
uniref:Synaptic vesicle 2-related protein isoform X3 n=1 Tax=Hirondellea gigas TaxID=1518452 RepID=A0A6A7FXZ3_9CRUS